MSFFFAAIKPEASLTFTRLSVSVGRLRSKSSILGLRFSLAFLFLLLVADLEIPPERLNVAFDKIASLKSADLFFCFCFFVVCSNLRRGFSSWLSLGSCSDLNSLILLAIDAFVDFVLRPDFFLKDYLG